MGLTERVTQACGRHGHPEFVLTCADGIAFDLPWLCGVLEGRVASGSVFAPGEIFQLGCSPLMIRNAPGGRLSLWELDFSGVAGKFDPGVTRSLLMLRRQKAVLESLGLENRLEFPTMRQAAIECTRFGDAPRRVLSRLSPNNPDDSGWFFGCAAADHDHDRSENLRGSSLYEKCCANRVVLDYLAMPVGSIVVIDRLGRLEKAFGPDEKELTVREGSFLAMKPGMP